MKKIIAILIILEMSLTSLGFCGHSHDHHEKQSYFNKGSCMINHQHVIAMHDHNHDDGEKPDHDSHCCSNKYHCSCLGGFIGEFTEEHFFIILPDTPFENKNKNFKPFLLIHSYYRPPKR